MTAAVTKPASVWVSWEVLRGARGPMITAGLAPPGTTLDELRGAARGSLPPGEYVLKIKPAGRPAYRVGLEVRP